MTIKYYQMNTLIFYSFFESGQITHANLCPGFRIVVGVQLDQKPARIFNRDQRLKDCVHIQLAFAERQERKRVVAKVL